MQGKQIFLYDVVVKIEQFGLVIFLYYLESWEVDLQYLLVVGLSQVCQVYFMFYFFYGQSMDGVGQLYVQGEFDYIVVGGIVEGMGRGGWQL